MPQSGLPDRYNTVIKSNEIIQKSRHQLTMSEQRIILYVIAQIEIDDRDFKTYEIDIADYMRTCGIPDGGQQYKELEDTIQTLADKSWWMDTPDRKKSLCRWVSKAKINSDTGKLEIRLDDDLKPYLLQLKKNFTQYQLLHCLAFGSKYSTRMYEYVCSIHYDKRTPYCTELTLDQVRDITGAPYTKWINLRQRVLDKACREINEYSDKIISYIPKKTGRAVTSIFLEVTKKNSHELFSAEYRVNQILDGNPNPDPIPLVFLPK